MNETIYLAVGSNLGARETNLRQALEMLPPAVTVRAVSRLYETEPAYVLEQPAFLNIALKGETALSPQALLKHLKDIEETLGREKTIRFGPRLIDLDILLYGERVVQQPDLQIPHPRMAERAFVLRPLADVAADVVHPVSGQTIAALVAALPDEDGIVDVRNWSPF